MQTIKYATRRATTRKMPTIVHNNGKRLRIDFSPRIGGAAVIIRAAK